MIQHHELFPELAPAPESNSKLHSVFGLLPGLTLATCAVTISATIYALLSGIYVRHQPWMDHAIEHVAWMDTATTPVSNKSIGIDSTGRYYLTTVGCVEPSFQVKPECMDAAIMLPIIGE